MNCKFLWNHDKNNIQDTHGHEIKYIKDKIVRDRFRPVYHKTLGLGWTKSWDNTGALGTHLTLFVPDAGWPMLEQEILAAEIRQKRNGKK